MKAKRSTYIILAVIMLVGLYLRAVGLNEVSFSNDELSALNRTQFSSVAEMIQTGIIELDYHPAATQLFLYGWTKMVGLSEGAVRAPFVLFGMITIWLTFLVGRIWGGDRTGLIASALLAALSFPVLYSRLARPYAMAACTVMACAYFWSLIVRNEKTPDFKRLAGFVGFGVLTVFTHYYAAICVGILSVVGLLIVPADRVKPYLLSGVSMIVLSALHWPITGPQIAKGGLGGDDGGWLDRPGENWLMGFFEYAFNGPVVFWIIIGLVIVGIVSIASSKIPWRPFTFFVACFFLNYLFGSIYSNQVSAILQHSGLLFAFPLLLIAFAYAVNQLAIPTKTIIPMALLGIAGYTSLSLDACDPFGLDQFGRFKELAVAFDDWDKEHPGEVTFAANVNDPFYLEHYLTKKKTLAVEILKERKNLIDLANALRESKTEYFAFCWSNIQMPAEVYPLIQQYYPFIADRESHFNSEALLFSKTQHGPDLSTPRTKLALSWPSQQVSTGVYSLNTEYGPAVEISLQQMRENGVSGQPYIYVETELSTSSGSSPVLVMEWKRNKETIHWSGSELGEFHASGLHKRVIHVQKMPNELWLDDRMKLYIWNRGKEPISLENLTVWVQDEL